VVRCVPCVVRTWSEVCTIGRIATAPRPKPSSASARGIFRIILFDYTHQLGNLREELGAERARREIAERTLRDGMAEEQRRREAAERERDDLRRELFAPREQRESPETVEEEPERAEPRQTTVETQEPVQSPWWRRILRR
jgi:hypothetical protein